MRPTFYLVDDYEKENPIRAGGVLFYKKNDVGKYELLMIYSRDRYEDFGGQTDPTDEDLVDTVSREAEEESNKIFTKEFIKEKIKDIEPIYIKNCKYMLYIVEIDKYYDPKIFGDKEIHEDIDRTMEWVPYDELKHKRLNFRLTDRNVTRELNRLLLLPKMLDQEKQVHY